MGNPLLKRHILPPFEDIKAEHIEPAIDDILKQSKIKIEDLLEKQTTPITWNSLHAPLEEIDDLLNHAWSPVSHMNAVVNNDSLRKVYNACLPKISEYSTWYGQNNKLYQAYTTLRADNGFSKLDAAQKQAIEHILRDFKLSGVSLDKEKQKHYKEISRKLSELQSHFSDNVLDATMSWSKHITNQSELEGLPKSAMDNARRLAKNKALEGWLLNLEFPCYQAVITHCHNRKLREEVYRAYTTRASNQSANKSFDNTAIIKDILSLRQKLANLLDFKNYAQLSLETKMAPSCQEVLDFLNDLVKRCKPQAEKELENLILFAKEQGHTGKLEAWDLAYFSEKLKKEKFSINQEDLRPWFPLEKVLNGFFAITEKLFNIKFRPKMSISTWHKDVQCFDVLSNGEPIAVCYLDFYAREHKRGGAWMDEYSTRRIRSDGSLQKPVVYITTNFTPPQNGKSALLTHDEAITLFHEFGHGLHHMLTKINYAEVSGINGVAWDMVELPSQFMENFCWQKESIAMISAHFETGESLPENMLDKLLESKNFQAAMGLLRQLEFALFDFKLHQYIDENLDIDSFDVQNFINSIRQQVAVVMPPDFNRFQNSFGHIFAGGYAAGYYSYLWAEVLSSDAFSLFEEKGIFDAQSSQSFLHNILEKGGSADPMDLYVKFRGKKPTIDALLRHFSISSE